MLSFPEFEYTLYSTLHICRYCISDSIFFTDIAETAAVAVRLCPCCTDISSVVYKPVAEVIAFLWRNDLPEFHFHFFRVLQVMDKTDAVGKADTVGICYNGWFAEYITHDKVGTFAANSREF